MATRFTAGSEVTIRALLAAYGVYVFDLLSDRLGPLPRARGAQRRYLVKADLPSVEDYREALKTWATINVEGVVGDSFSRITDVAGELRDWYDNLPEGLQGSDTGSRLEKAADALEAIQEPDLPDVWVEVDGEQVAIGKIPVVFYPTIGYHGAKSFPSRAAQLQEAAALLRAVVEVLADFDDPALESYRGEVEEMADEVEGVEPPGMFGQ